MCLGQDGEKQGSNSNVLLLDVNLGCGTMGSKMAVGTKQSRRDTKEGSTDKFLKL